MTDIQAALGLSQLKRLEEFVNRRNQLARRYDNELEILPVRKQKMPQGIQSSNHLYIIRVPNQMHHSLFEKLRRSGIGVNLHYIPVHLQPYYRKLGFQEDDFPEAEAYGSEAISLPLYPDLNDEHQDYVIETLKQNIHDQR